MKKTMTIVLLLSLATLGAGAQKIKGSDTVLPFAQKVAEQYKKEGKGYVAVTGGGSGVGIAALIDGSTDIAMASRKIKFDEKLKLRQARKEPIEKVIAWDALAVIVNPRNRLSGLTRQQLEDIFTGKITNWKVVGGPDMKIVVYSRESSSGTYEFFKEIILKNKNYKNSILSMPATGAIIQSVSQTPGAIGYVGLAYLTKSVKALNVSSDGKNFITPSYENAKNKTYPVVRPLYLYYLKSEVKKVTPFMNYIAGEKGQKIAKEMGYIDIIL